MTPWQHFLLSFFNIPVLIAAIPAVLHGMLITVELGALVIPCGISLGLVLALVRTTKRRVLSWPVIFVVDLLRAVPPLVIMVLFYFGLPSAGIELSGFAVTWLALTLVLMAFAEEIFWAAIRSVPRGQGEAAKALGLRPTAVLRFVVLPQALRVAVPQLTNRSVAITKSTALGAVVGVSEILGAAQTSMAFSGNPSPLILAAAAYTLIFIPVVLAGRWIERRAVRGN
jgi:polar amino acid transport system permease protein